MRPLNIKQYLPVLLLAAFGTTLSSCWGTYVEPPPEDPVREEAYVPVYGVDPDKRTIKGLPPQPIVRSGKIYVWGNYLFQVEQLAGVHVINYADKQNPVKLGFIASKGCTEVAVKGGYLIVNNLRDLVTVDITQPSDPKEVSRMKDAFFNYNMWELLEPPATGVYYQCPDPSKGDVIGWTLEKKVRTYCHN